MVNDCQSEVLVFGKFKINCQSEVLVFGKFKINCQGFVIGYDIEITIPIFFICN